MDNPPANTNNGAASPEPEALKPRSEDGSLPAAPIAPAGGAGAVKLRRRTYRPSHRATFLGLGAVIIILAVNAAVIGFLLKKQAKSDQEKKGQVTISSEQLSKLGINRNAIGSAGVELVVSPDAQFKGKLSVAGNTNISGQLKVNSKFTGTDASITKLQAGETDLSKLNVNGDGTLQNLNLRQKLVVAGQTQLQGPLNVNQLLTVSGSINVSGNVAIGGVLTVSTFSARSLTSTSTLSIGGHILTFGSSPSVGPAGGGALGSNGTLGISGDDTAGVISVNIGVGATGGGIANVAFRNQYSSLPRVVITPVYPGVINNSGSFYIYNLSVGGFSVGVTSGLAPGGYKVNFIVMQ